MRFLLCLLCFSMAHAQTFQITEISPQKVGETAEWFEFYVEGEVDLSQYQVSNTKNLPKPLDTARPGVDEGYFYFEKSPVSLANDGGIIQILDLAGNVLTEASYPKTKAGTTKNYKWAEVWNWSEKYQQFLPLIYRSDGDSRYLHSPGKNNQNLPTPADQYQLIFSEASPDWKKEGYEFLEFYVETKLDEVNLKYAEFKHNGTSLFTFEEDFWVESGDFILLYVEAPSTGITKRSNPYEIWSDRRDGLSGGSGTIEAIAYTATSLESTEDFACWQDGVLSKTEQKRVDKNILAGHWSGPCYEYADNLVNESIARHQKFTDTNSAADFWHHYNGSPGSKNVPTNQPPVPIIRIQGTGRTVGDPPFSLNVTGEDSTDPDGNQDLKSFVWLLNDAVFSEAKNPLNYKIETAGDYELKLVAEDYSGARTAVTATIVVTPLISAPSASNSLSFQAQLAAQVADFSQTKNASETSPDFFAPVLNNTAFLETLRQDLIPKNP